MPGWSTDRARAVSKSFSHLPMTMVATALPRTLMKTRPSLRMRSTPTIRERAASGMWPTAVTVLARTMNAPPAMPAVPLLVSIMTPTMTSCCCQDRSMPMAWARNIDAIVR